MKVKNYFLAIALLTLLSTLAQAQATISCTGTFYLSRYKSATNATEIVRVTPSPYAEAPFVAGTSGLLFNALAYDSITALLYAMTNDNRLLQIDGAGVVTILGTIPGLPVTGWAGGTFDDSGGYWIASRSSSNLLYKVNPQTRTALALPTSQPIVNAGDLVFNSLDGLFYLSATDNYLYKITQTGATTILPSTGFQALFIDGAGQLYGHGNGIFAKIDAATGQTTHLTPVPPTTDADGAGCPYFIPVVRPIINLSETVNYQSFPSPGMDLTYTTRFSNNGTQDARNLCVTQSVAESTDFKLNSIYIAVPPAVRFTIFYSSNFNRRNPNPLAAAAAASWDYVPVSGGGGALPGYDRRVKAIQIRTTNPFSYLYPYNEGYLLFIAQIQ